MAGLNSPLEAAELLKPPSVANPPEGTVTVELMRMIVAFGAGTKIWKIFSGGPTVLPLPGPRRICGTANWRGTSGPVGVTDKKVPDRLMRTKRRSAETTGVTWKFAAKP